MNIQSEINEKNNEIQITIDMIDIIVELLGQGNKLKGMMLGVHDISSLICQNCGDDKERLEYIKISKDTIDIIKYIDKIKNKMIKLK